MKTQAESMLFRWLTRNGIVLAVAVLCGLSAAHAAPVPLKAEEIRTLLAGNTVMFNIGKLTQRQYFDAKGYSVFEDENFNLDKGLWTVTDDGLLCSNWKQAGWTCYQLALEGATLSWTGPINPFGAAAGEQTLSRLLRGNQTTFSAPQGSRADELVATVTRELEAVAQ